MPEATAIEVPFVNVAIGTYLVRTQVDGAESVLAADRRCLRRPAGGVRMMRRLAWPVANQQDLVRELERVRERLVRFGAPRRSGEGTPGGDPAAGMPRESDPAPDGGREHGPRDDRPDVPSLGVRA